MNELSASNNKKKDSKNATNNPNKNSNNSMKENNGENKRCLNDPEILINCSTTKFTKPKNSSFLLPQNQQADGTSKKSSSGDYYQAGDIVDQRFKVLSKLGQGGYSQVYKVELIEPIRSDESQTKTFLHSDSLSVGDKFALKVEKVNVVTHRLKSEAAILQKLTAKVHFANIFGFGNNGISSYMVQSLCGFDLHELAKSREYAGISTKLSCQLAMQMIHAIREFHEIGYLHRDIKPSNFVIRRISQSPAQQEPPKTDKDDCFEDQQELRADSIEELPSDVIVCLIDFGVARRFMNADGTLRPSRQDGIPRFRGTNRYSSIRNYQSKELGRCDDMISFYYSIIEITSPGGLPWRHISDKQLTCQMKKKYDPEEQHKSLASKNHVDFLTEFYNEVSEANYEDDIDYEKYVEGAWAVLNGQFE